MNKLVIFLLLALLVGLNGVAPLLKDAQEKRDLSAAKILLSDMKGKDPAEQKQIIARFAKMPTIGLSAMSASASSDNETWCTGLNELFAKGLTTKPLNYDQLVNIANQLEIEGCIQVIDTQALRQPIN